MTEVVCPASVRISLPDATFQSLMVSPAPAETMVLPSGEKVEESEKICPVSVRISLPETTSHSLIVPSKLVETIVLPSGENSAELTD